MELLIFELCLFGHQKKKLKISLKKNLDAHEDKIIEKPMSELLKLARTLGFSIVRFDFQAKGVHPKQGFVNYRLIGNGILDLLSMFKSFNPN